ncbi:MAG: hypothetical protein LBL75_04105 [Rickettsiales bacterium]|jgi:hypothetical protein|nr:hypothetical protein [Rickettsiales bacterium]
MKKVIKLFFLIMICMPIFSAYSDDDLSPAMDAINPPITESIMVDGVVAEPVETEKIPTEPVIVATCAQSVIGNALVADAASVNSDSPVNEIYVWIYKNIQSDATMKQILACPEIASLDETETFVVPTVQYVFPNGRTIVVNYEAQPKVLKQRLSLVGKKALPCSSDDAECISPRVGAPGDENVWTNTEPAWYGILVVRAGSLDEYIGPDKNNTISLRYFADNIRKFYPASYNNGTTPLSGPMPRCTTQSAFADDKDIINLAAVKTIGLEDAGETDTNDYYVAGDVNLQWVAWSQVALDVGITIATMGAGTGIMAATKVFRAAKVSDKLLDASRALDKLPKVKELFAVRKQLDAVNDRLKQAKGLEDIAKKSKGENMATDLKYAQDEIKKANDEITNINKQIANLETFDDVKKYRKIEDNFEKVWKVERNLKAWRTPQRGNVVARTWRRGAGVVKTLKAINKSDNVIKSAEKVARAGVKSGRIRNWLFRSTLSNVRRLGKIVRNTGFLYGAMKIVGDMYDYTETATGEFTNNIEFSPLGLLSADDIKGSENVVNYGMWLMWVGDSLSANDDNAAYLQAMDFANKFHQDVNEVQTGEIEKGRTADTLCDIDIFVVRPIIRNPDADNPELYYLIMNDVPWQVRSN